MNVLLKSAYVSVAEYWLIENPGRRRGLDVGQLLAIRKKRGSVTEIQVKRLGQGREKGDGLWNIKQMEDLT